MLEIGPQPAGTQLHLFIDGGSADRQGPFRASITALLAEGENCAGGEPWVCASGLVCGDDDTCEPAACSNQADDDGDGAFDFPNDPVAQNPSDDDEEDPDFPEVCANAIDDDEDGFIDWPDDPDCAGAGSPSEEPACSDRIDNDGDGSSDYDRDGNGFRDANADPGCACVDDNDEQPNPQCGDGCDNDNDGLIDIDDPGCLNDPNGGSEFNVAQCRDGQDNDMDGFIDFPNDPGCPTQNSPLERNPDPLPACGDGIDNDEDGAIDFAGGAGDDGCSSAAD